jgi:hypothetical protein
VSRVVLALTPRRAHLCALRRCRRLVELDRARPLNRGRGLEGTRARGFGVRSDQVARGSTAVRVSVARPRRLERRAGDDKGRARHLVATARQARSPGRTGLLRRVHREQCVGGGGVSRPRGASGSVLGRVLHCRLRACARGCASSPAVCGRRSRNRSLRSRPGAPRGAHRQRPGSTTATHRRAGSSFAPSSAAPKPRCGATAAGCSPASSSAPAPSPPSATDALSDDVEPAVAARRITPAAVLTEPPGPRRIRCELSVLAFGHGALSRSSPTAVHDGPVSNSADDDRAALDGVDDAIVAHAGRPEPLEATDEPFSRALRLQPDQSERLEDCSVHGWGQCLQVFLRTPGESGLRQARARASPRQARQRGPPSRPLRSHGAHPASPGPARSRASPRRLPTPRSR